MATEHEIKLIATVDTSQVNGQAGTHASSGGSRSSSAQTAAQAVVATSANKAANSINIAAQNAVKSSELIKNAFQAITFRLKELSDRIHVISYMYRRNQEAVSASDRTFRHLTNNLTKIQSQASRSTERFIQSIDAASDAAQRNARINAMTPPGGGGGGGAGGGALGALGGKFGLKSGMRMLGRFAGWGSVFKAFTSASSTLEETDPEEKTFASAVFRKAPRAAMDALTLGITYYARQALEAKKAMDESAASLEELKDFLKKLNDEIQTAKLNKYAREQKEALEKLSDGRLSKFVDEHREKLEELKEKYNQINDQIARGDVGRNIDELKKKMSDLNAQISVEQELYDAASNKMKQAAEAAKKLAEETENLNKAFNKQQQQYQDTLQKEQRAEQRREWKYSPIDQLIREKAGINAEFNKATEAIKAIDAEISRLKEFYEIQTTNEGRSSIIDKINELIGQRSRISGQKGQAQSDIDAINSIVKSFQDAAEALKKKAQDLVDSEEFKQWQAALKGKSRQELDQMKKELEEERDARREEAIEAYNKGSEAPDKAGQDYWRKMGEEAEKAMKDAETRIKEIESATKDDIKLEDPTDQMTSMGKIGMYMSMNEATLQDPKLEKLNHISLTLVQIERNTQQGTVSRFL